MGFLGGSDGKESACNVGDQGLIPGFSSPVGSVDMAMSWFLWRLGIPMKGCSCLPEKYSFIPVSFHRILLEKSQNEYLESTQTPGPSSDESAEE